MPCAYATSSADLLNPSAEKNAPTSKYLQGRILFVFFAKLTGTK